MYAILIWRKNQVYNRKVFSEGSRLHNHLGYTELMTNSRSFLVTGILRVSRLKSPVINTSFILLSKARPIESLIEYKVCAGEFRRSVKFTKEEFSMMNSDFNPNTLDNRQFEIISAM